MTLPPLAQRTPMTYARQRLWLGITGVGTTVVLALAAVTLDLPHRFIHPLADTGFGTALASIALAWMLHALLLLPADMIGGLLVVRDSPGVGRWIASWLRGVLVQWAWFALATALLLRFAQQFGNTVAILVFLLLQLVLVSRQGLIAWLVGGVRVAPVSDALRHAASEAGLAATAVREIGSDEPSFVGGWTGFDARQLWVPQRWVEALPASQLVLALRRRRAVRVGGLRRRGVLVAMAWNTVGLVLATSLPRADLVTAAGFVTTICWFTLWSFVGVLVLPTLSRRAVFAADRAVRGDGDPALLAQLITRLDGWQDDEAERGAGVETVFHPVPSRGSRLRALAAPAAPLGDASGAWHATRMMLFLSWAGIGGLARAVHCNVGRPAVWVLFPGD